MDERGQVIVGETELDRLELVPWHLYCQCHVVPTGCFDGYTGDDVVAYRDQCFARYGNCAGSGRTRRQRIMCALSPP